MIRSLLFLLALLAFTSQVQAQSGTAFGFEYRPAGAVVQGTDTLRNAWMGGLNTPQFSSIDLNNDGQQDLFAFDHESSRCYTFLSVAAPAAPNGRRWQYAPQYESLFPSDLRQWALLRDYDCDGRADLFTFTSGGDIRVFRNVLNGNRPSFQLTTNQIRFTGLFPGSANLTIGGYNLPAIQDVNGDGKLDIMTYDFISASFIEQYINNSPGTCGNALTFTLTTDNWGGLQACGNCASYMFNGQTCFTAAKTLHTGGHGLLLVDLDGDGDQDLLDGRDNCSELVRLLNQGTTTAPVVTQAGISAGFPSAAAPVRVSVFPVGYAFDANFDGRADLVVAPNMVNNLADQVSLSHQIQLFANAASSGAPSYSLSAGGFLQNDMIEVSEGAAPTFGDLDGDGLADMLVGNYADRVGTTYRATLAYYRNVGTRARPVFKLMSSDYLGLSAQNLTALKPVLVDLNRDGALDLAYGAWDRGTNLLHYILNTAPAGQPVALSAVNTGYFKSQGAPGSGILPYASGDMPCFTDVDNDGYVDLLIGTNETREPGKSLRYFRNRGRGPIDSAFVLANNDFGRIRDASGAGPLNLSPTVADFDGDGRPDLVTVDASGLLRLFSDYRAQGSQFSERTDVLYNPATGQYEETRLGLDFYSHCALAAADVNGDGAPELFVGTQAGGVISYGTRNRGTATATKAEAARALALSIYPNPATARATVETAAPTRVSVLDLAGRVVRPAGAAQRRHELELTGLAAGVYLVRAVGADGAAAVQRLAVE
ncbi:T9SS type A sorting domain-containing protein [Hymenobacter sp. DH14]|uniref:T9SS type A sorting domain-containing protein n=1 Tax=Hymenobacter cyanobacteriorum TaxID=2926463 RepID=A0A9X2AGK5_9BACT|nr:T9SS type A sorting domain-containing protein [Hymenobacter cyanobacteriorum]MCI1187763.1 T9SS type A sorting domain-containing protein [Hymenobacter cyanobacteriorum]